MPVRVCYLMPGDLVIMRDSTPLMPKEAVFIGKVTPHPLYPTLCMVIWWLPEIQEYSFDALSPIQELPGYTTKHLERIERLRQILTPGATS